MIDRPSLLSLLRSSALAGRFDFVRAAALDWLAVWPGDAEVQQLLAQAEIELGHDDLAVDRLIHLLSVDPEDMPAYLALAECLRRKGDAAQARVYAACGRALRGVDPDRNATPPWAAALTRSFRAQDAGDTATALQQAALALSADPDSPLPTLVALKAHLALGDHAAAAALAAASFKRWPECVALRLVHATALLEAGQVATAVDALHRASVDDPTGAITQRWLGPAHPYKNLWPIDLQAHLSRPVPADVAAAMGDNRLAAGSPTDRASQAAAVPPTPSKIPRAVEDEADLPTPEPWEAFRGPSSGDPHPNTDPPPPAAEMQRDIARMAVRVKGRKSTERDQDRRVPSYILLSSETRLLQQFGPAGFKQIDSAVQALCDAVRHRKGWTAHRVYVDDPASLSPYDLTPADPGNAWQIKLRLADLDTALRRKGEMIGTVLIIGGDSVIPFHRLPNPTDDDDDAVPSDNPYATTDENYFAPEWPVGRIPVDSDAALLTRLLTAATKAHKIAVQPTRPLDGLRSWFQLRFGRLLAGEARAFGYSASIWRKSSMAVYRSIGAPRSMVTSPPVEAGALPAAATRAPHLSYFNLHGLEDSPEWFGQRDPMREPNATEFPVALRPGDVVNGGRAPKVVYTEACYGANTLGKTSETCLSLKFLDSGTSVVVGSTKIAYGSVTTPLIAADHLGKSYWDNLTAGLPAGEALRRAKLDLAAEMAKRQGYLDGEDQKTLISFVLYGDPLYMLTPSRVPLSGKVIARRTTRPGETKTACALGECNQDGNTLDDGPSDRVRSIVSHYLPGMADAEARVHSQHCGCSGLGHSCPTSQIGSKQAGFTDVGTTVVTLSKAISEGDRRHARYARLTLDASGKVLKLTVSR
jgi:tetratricopeptide (TPR) repeat protein